MRVLRGNPRPIILAICCILLLPSSTAIAENTTISAKTREFCRKVVADIYHDILDLKDQYDDLQDFGEDVLYENASGIYALVYEYKNPNAPQRPPYRLGLSIVGIDDPLFRDEKGAIRMTFPLLGVKLVGYQPPYLKDTQFDMIPVIRNHVWQLSEFEQDLLPLRLSLEPVKKDFKVGEEISFDVVLKNVSDKHMYVKSLGSKTLFFLLNDLRWGTRPSEYAEGGEPVVLHTGEELRVRFKGDGYRSPQDVMIYGFYNVGISGVKPHARTRIHISK